MASAGIQEGVGCGIARLSCGPDQAGAGGEDHEEVQRSVQGLLVEVPGARHLGGEDPIEAAPALIPDQAVVKQPRGVNDPTERQLRGQIGEELP
jgi:hypothetical protein